MLRSLFIGLSTNRALRAFSERSAVGRRISRRFVAGMTVDEAIAATAALNAEGLDVSIDALGESVLQVAQAEEAAAVYHRLLDAIAANNLRANISLKLTQMGLDIGANGSSFGAGPELAERIVAEVVAHAAATNNFVRIDMEGSAYTETTLALTERLHQRWPSAVGTVLQASLLRTAADTSRLLAQNIRIRLCKGAYKEPPSVAFAAKSDVDANYSRLMQTMVTSGVFCGIATHDEAIIDELCAFTAAHNLDKRTFEFQMLYGIRRDLQRKLVAQGYGVRVYLPFGPAWYPYFMRRLAERPANVLFLARNFFKA